MRLSHCRKIRLCGIPRSSGLRFRSSCAGNSSKRILKSSTTPSAPRPDMFPLGIQARGHRQRSVLDRSDRFAQLHGPYLQRGTGGSCLLAARRDGTPLPRCARGHRDRSRIDAGFMPARRQTTRNAFARPPNVSGASIRSSKIHGPEAGPGVGDGQPCAGCKARLRSLVASPVKYPQNK